jgi:hypothetical protein
MEEQYKLQTEDVQLLRAFMGNIVNDINHVARNSIENSSALRVNPNTTASQFQNTLKTLVHSPVVTVKEETSYPTPDGGSVPMSVVNNPANASGLLTASRPTKQNNANDSLDGNAHAKTALQPVDYVLAINQLNVTLVALNDTLKNCSFYTRTSDKKKLKKKLKHGVRNQSRNVG